MKHKPNLILIGIDSLRRDHMSLYGYPRLTTPHIDKYAASGAVFENLFSPHIPTTPGTAGGADGRSPCPAAARSRADPSLLFPHRTILAAQ